MEIDSDLVRRALNGNSEAFGLLTKMYRQEIYAIALGIAGDPTDAEDLTQEAFIKAYLSLSQLKEPEKFGPWLRRIAQNHCRDWVRTHGQQYPPMDNLFSAD